MMTRKQVATATLDELNEELAAAGFPSGETDLANARKAVRAVIAEFQRSAKTADGLTIYDLQPQASELCVVAGPEGYSVDQIDMDNLPADFRWVTAEEWETLQHA